MNLYAQAIAADPLDPFGYAFRGILEMVYFHTWDKAIADLTKAINIWDRFPRIYVYRGGCRLSIQDLRGAVEDFQKAAQLNPLDAEIYLNWGRSHQFLLEYDKSEVVLTEGIKRFPKDIQLYQERGVGRAKNNKFEEAIKDFTNVLALNPSEINARNGRAGCYSYLQKYAEAITDLTYLIDNRYANRLTLFNRAFAFFATGDAAKSIADAERALRIDSTFHAARLVIAKAHHLLGQPQRAVEVASSILQRNPQESAAFSNVLGVVNAAEKANYIIAPDTYFTRALARMQMGDTVGAVRDIDKAYFFEQKGRKLPDADVKTILEAGKRYEQHQIFLPSVDFPASVQLFPRNAQDSAIITLSGQIQRVNYQEYDSVYVELFKSNVLQQRSSLPLRYEGSIAAMSLNLSLHAELALYGFRIGLKSASRQGGNSSASDTIVLRRDSILCGDAFLVAGQSNVVLGTLPSTPHNAYIHTFSAGVRDSYWGLAAANDNTDDYNVGALALQMAEEYVAARHVPVAFVHGGLSGSIIELHLPKNDFDERLDNATWYGHTLRYASRSGLQQSFRLALWYHGEANTDQDYIGKFATLMHYWQKDYPSLRKIYTVQIRPARCGQEGQASLREQQRHFKEISSILTLHASAGVDGFNDCHYTDAGYAALGKQLARLLSRDFYASADTIGIASPMLLRAAWTGADRKEIVLDFDTNDSLVVSPDVRVSGTLQTLAQSSFLLNGQQIPALSVRTSQKRVFVTFANAGAAQNISYVPDKFYTTAPDDVYAGPWLMTKRGVGALTFYNVKIEAP